MTLKKQNNNEVLRTYKINEIFGPVIQGEGEKCGKLCYFIRFAGCDQNPPCKWCDTLNAYSNKNSKEMNVYDIIKEIKKLNNNSKNPIRIILTGGNPCIQNLEDFVKLFNDKYGCENEFCIETQGTIFPHWLIDLDHITISPKGPSSMNNNKGQEYDNIIEFIEDHIQTVNFALEEYPEEDVRIPEIELKIVIFNDDDFKYAENIFSKIFNNFDKKYISYTIQLGTPMNNIKNILSANDIINKLYNSKLLTYKFINKVRILPQIHRLINVQ